MKTLYTIIAAFLMSLVVHADNITTGDTLQIMIKGVPVDEQGQITGEYVVDSSGRLKLPYLNSYISARGSSTSTVARRIEAAYKSAKIYTTPTITIKSMRAQTAENQKIQKFVNITGQVGSPGPKLYRPGMTINEAVYSAAPTTFAAVNRVELQRNGRVHKYNLKNSKHRVLRLYPGDSVNVPQVNWLGK